MKKDLIHVAIATHSRKQSKKIIDWIISQGVNTNPQITGEGVLLYYWVNHFNCIQYDALHSIPRENLKVFKTLSAAKAWYNRPVIEFKPEFDAKLRELGVRTAFIERTIKAPKLCNCDWCRLSIDKRIEVANSCASFYDFIFSCPVIVGQYPYNFWCDIAEGYNPITEVRLQESEVVNE